MTVPRLDEFLKGSDKFETKKSLLIFSKLHYRATGEKLIEGFRYFACDAGDLLERFSARDFKAISELPFALDDDGEVDTSSVLLDLAYVESGSFVAAQPVEYQNYDPVGIAPVLLLEGDEAKAAFSLIKALDQSS